MTETMDPELMCDAWDDLRGVPHPPTVDDVAPGVVPWAIHCRAYAMTDMDFLALADPGWTLMLGQMAHGYMRATAYQATQRSAGLSKAAGIAAGVRRAPRRLTAADKAKAEGAKWGLGRGAVS